MELHVCLMLMLHVVPGFISSNSRFWDLQIAWVPGSFELPVVAKGLAKSGKYDAVVCIGAVVSN